MSRFSCQVFTTFLFFLINGCVHSPEGGHEQHVVARDAALSPTWEAHGGLKTWQNFRSLSFSMTAGSLDGTERIESFQIDLQDRKERIQGEGYMMGFDGENYWQELLDTSVEEKNVEFQINLQFYFFAMPFVLADPGVNLEPIGDRSLMGKPFKVIRATFDAGTGVAPEDQYILYLDPETEQLEVLLYSVTFYDSSRADNYSALHYAEWQRAGDLLVPRKVIRYQWNEELMTFGPMRGEKLYNQVEFAEKALPNKIFSPPDT